MIEPLHTYPNSVNLLDLAHTPDVFIDTEDVVWTSNECVDGCALCDLAICIQRVETFANGNKHIVPGSPLH